MTHINHVISKQLVQFAKDFGMGLRFEDLSEIRETSKQRKRTKSDAGSNRDSWALILIGSNLRLLGKFECFWVIRLMLTFIQVA